MPTLNLYHRRRAFSEQRMAANSATRMAQIVHVELARLHNVFANEAVTDDPPVTGRAL